MAKFKRYVKKVGRSFKGYNPFSMFQFDGIINADTFRDLFD